LNKRYTVAQRTLTAAWNGIEEWWMLYVR